MTPEAPAPKIICDKFPECTKVYKSRARMLGHMKTVHKDPTSEGTTLSSPVRLALFNIREDGGVESEARTQGNSKGEVNVTKVVSEGRFVCSFCDEDFSLKTETLKHIADTHGEHDAVSPADELAADISGESEVLEEACEDQDLYEALEQWNQELKEPEKVESNEEISKKVERFQVLVEKKTQIQKETNDEVVKLREVESDQKKCIERKENDITVLKRAAATEKDKHKKELGTLQKRIGELIKENNNLTTMVKEKEAIVVALEDQTNNAQEDDSVVEEEVQIRNSPSVHSCAACDKRFGTNNDLERHISDKHNEVECPFCEQIFSNRNALKGHVNNCIDNGTVKVKCRKCKQTFTRFVLKRHENSCHEKN